MAVQPGPQVPSAESGDATVVSVIKEDQREFAGGVGGNEMGPCWAKNQSVAVVSGVPSAFNRREVALVAEVP